MKDKLPKEYDFLAREEARIDRLTARIFWLWGSVAAVMIGISAAMAFFWPLFP